MYPPFLFLFSLCAFYVIGSSSFLQINGPVYLDYFPCTCKKERKKGDKLGGFESPAFLAKKSVTS
jgi:hypothetical protein